MARIDHTPAGAVVTYPEWNDSRPVAIKGRHDEHPDVPPGHVRVAWDDIEFPGLPVWAIVPADTRVTPVDGA